MGQTLAMLMFVLGLLYNPILMLISVFIWLGAAGEAGAEAIQHALHRIRAREVMMDRFVTLSASDSLQQAVDLTVHSGQHHFPVVCASGALRLLGHDSLLASLRQMPESTRLGELNLPELRLVSGDMAADQLFAELQKSGQEVAGVTEAGALKGLVSMAGLSTWIQLHQGPDHR